MKVIKIGSKTHRITYRVYEDDGIPNTQINDFLKQLDKRGYTRNSVRASAYDLAKFGGFLNSRGLDIGSITQTTLVDFLYAFRFQGSNNSVPDISKIDLRSDSTISRMFSSISSFVIYRHNEHGDDLSLSLTNRSLKGFLSHARHSHPRPIKTLKRLSPKKGVYKPPEIYSDNEIERIVKACPNQRDRLLVMLLIETGMRIGQALQLRHEDIESWNGRLLIEYRENNENDVYAKTQKPYFVDLSKEWLDLYTDFLLGDAEDVESPYIFTCLYHRQPGSKERALSYPAVQALFRGISRKIGVKVEAHKFRHTHATTLLSNGVPIEHVSKRLGHTSVTTTSSIYSHLTSQDIRRAINESKHKTEQEQYPVVPGARNHKRLRESFEALISESTAQ